MLLSLLNNIHFAFFLRNADRDIPFSYGTKMFKILPKITI